MEIRFYKCEHCGNIIVKIKDAKVGVHCCGEKMKELIAGTVDASREKHIPEYTVDNNVVKVVVGSVEHPMAEVHYIEWILVHTNLGYQIKYLQPGQKPEAEFVLAAGEEVVAVYEYCNLHGLWKK